MHKPYQLLYNLIIYYYHYYYYDILIYRPRIDEVMENVDGNLSHWHRNWHVFKILSPILFLFKACFFVQELKPKHIFTAITFAIGFGIGIIHTIKLKY